MTGIEGLRLEKKFIVIKIIILTVESLSDNMTYETGFIMPFKLSPGG